MAAIALIIGAGIAIIALTDGGVFNESDSDEERVVEVVTGFFMAAAEGDSEAYCATLTPGARERVERGAARASGVAASEVECEQVAAGGGGDGIEGLETRIRDLGVSGNRARVQVMVKAPEQPAEVRTLFLESPEPGVWLISNAG